MMFIDIRWIVLLHCALLVLVGTWAYPVLIGPLALVVAVTGLLYVLMRLGR